ncbi:MAG: hypothetical protein Q9159_007355 [Coniocarpon cinnabarinum]
MHDREAQVFPLKSNNSGVLHLVPKLWPSRASRKPPSLVFWAALIATIFLLGATVSLWRLDSPRETVANFLRPLHHHGDLDVQQQSQHHHSNTPLHLLLPASNPDVNLCKLLLGASLLGYPTPVLAAWKDDYTREGILGGGSHLAKVSKVLEYLQSLPPEQDNDLVVMMDAYDIWLQLPKSVLIDRYYELRDAQRSRMVESLGKQTVEEYHLEPLVMFGAGKRCAPNLPHTVACFSLESSPLPDDLYGPNTDTIIGRNYWYSNKQRYLNSGFIMSPVAAMRRIFEEAWHLIQNHPDMDPLDDGGHGSDFIYHGSDQSIFAAMYGRQGWAREKLRLQHSPDAKPGTSHIMGTHIDNILKPSFHHEEVDLDVSHGNPWEFGIFLDFFSDIGHQTVNSEEDARWMSYDPSTWRPHDDPTFSERTAFDCPVRLPETLPGDVLHANVPGLENIAEMASHSLYTHLCLSRVPIIVHHNGIKERREWEWPKMWYQPNASAMMDDLRARAPHDPGTYEQAKQRPRLNSAGDAWSDKGEHLSWEQLCPAEWNGEIFRT